MLMTKFVSFFLKNRALEKLKTSPNIDISVLHKPISPINKTYIYFPFPPKLTTIITQEIQKFQKNLTRFNKYEFIYI
jgi:hypothetical protein